MNKINTNSEFGKYLKREVKRNKRIPLSTDEVIRLITSNYKDKIVTCNICGYEFSTQIKDNSRIRCKKCGSNESLSILSFSE